MEKKEPKWVTRWKTWIAAKPTKPGVWKRKEGGYLVRGRATDPRTGKIKEIFRILDEVDASGAYRWLQNELGAIRSGQVQSQRQRVRFDEYAASLFERKVAKGKIRSAKTREKWESTLRVHLYPPFGDMLVDAIRRQDIEAWLTKVGLQVAEGKYSPLTVNSWMAIFRVIINSAVVEYDLDRNPITSVEDIDTSTHRVYTEEEPNSLTVDEVPVFLKAMGQMFPQHLAMVALGFATGVRPSSLRPLRKEGEEADVKWAENVILMRRFHTRRDEIMEATKQKTHYRITLPEEMMAILRWHVEQLPERLKGSELLFPSEAGGFRAASCLDKAFRLVGDEIGLRKTVTPRCMRRTFQDLARSADVEMLVRQKICGHATSDMSELYSTVGQSEIRAAVGKVISLAKYQDVMKHSASWWESGGKAPVNENGQLAAQR